MGQGCNNSSINLFEKQIPDTQVKYTGEPIDALGICTGDLLSEVEAVMLQKIIDYATGVGISIPSIDLTTCDAFINCTTTCCSTCTDLPCLLECYKNTICTIWGDVETLKDEINTLLNGPYNATCLTGITTTSPLNVIIQELITEFCSLKTAFNVLNTSVSGFITGINSTIGTFLGTHLGSCQGPSVLNLSGSGATTEFKLKGFVPVGGIIPWAGDTVGKFNSTGLGISGTDWCGWAICNGQNNTPNMLGLVPVMATNISVGTTQPIQGRSFAYGTVGGEYDHTLTSVESGTGAHGHGIMDTGHSHKMTFGAGNARQGSPGTLEPNHVKFDGNYLTANVDGTVPNDGNTGNGSGNVAIRVVTNYTGISVKDTIGTNASAGHNNVQPYIALYYIQRVS